MQAMDGDEQVQHVTTTNTSISGPIRKLPRLHFSFNPIYLSLYLLFLIVLNVLVPCLLFYLLENGVYILVCRRCNQVSS
jgi:hypothetical protein